MTVSEIKLPDLDIEMVSKKNSASNTMKTQASLDGSDGCGVPTNPRVSRITALIESTARNESTVANESILANESNLASESFASVLVLSFSNCKVSC